MTCRKVMMVKREAFVACREGSDQAESSGRRPERIYSSCQNQQACNFAACFGLFTFSRLCTRDLLCAALDGSTFGLECSRNKLVRQTNGGTRVMDIQNEQKSGAYLQDFVCAMQRNAAHLMAVPIEGRATYGVEAAVNEASVWHRRLTWPFCRQQRRSPSKICVPSSPTLPHHCTTTC